MKRKKPTSLPPPFPKEILPDGLITGPDGAPFGIAIGSEGLSPRGPQMPDESKAAGKEVLDLITDALQRPTDAQKVDSLSELVASGLRREVLSHVEVYEFLEWLVEKEQHSAVDRILQEIDGPGRPKLTPESKFAAVAAMERVIQRYGWSARRAAEHVRKTVRAFQRSYASARSLENMYSKERDAYRIFKQVRYLPAAALAEDGEFSSKGK